MKQTHSKEYRFGFDTGLIDEDACFPLDAKAVKRDSMYWTESPEDYFRGYMDARARGVGKVGK